MAKPIPPIGPRMRNWPITAKVCAAVAVLTLAFGVGDFVNSAQKVPAEPQPCHSGLTGSSTEECQSTLADADAARFDRISQLNQGLQDREKVYVAIICLALLLAVVFTYPAEAVRRRRYFAGVGSVGVALLVFTAFLDLLVNSTTSLSPNTGITFFPALIMLAAAALGGMSTLIVRGPVTVASGASGPPPPPVMLPGKVEPSDPRLARIVNLLPWIGAGLGILTIVLFSSWANGQPPCGSGVPVSDSAKTQETLGWISYLAAVVSGLLLLIPRRWVAAIAIIIPCTFLVLVIGLGVAFRCD
jgi:hypothetical protein